MRHVEFGTDLQKLDKTMNRELVGNIDFAIMNGDWLYEELRATPPGTWLSQNGVALDYAPKQVRDMPTIVGVWAVNHVPKLDEADRPITRLVAFPNPQVILQYFDGRTGKLAYSQTITGPR